MSRIDEMIARLCPDGVEYRKLKELCRIEKGKTPIQKAIPGDYPLVVTAEERSSSVEYQLDGEAVCIPLVSSAGHGRATLKAVHYQSGKFALGNILAAVLPNDSEVLSAEFLYHYLMAKKDILLVPLMRGGANVSIPVERIGHVRIPAPPLDIQREIVTVLDVFAKLGVELEAELEARKEQYAHYRDELLSRESLEDMAGGEVPLVSLGDSFQTFTGKTPPKSRKDLFGNDYPFYKPGDFDDGQSVSSAEDGLTEDGLALSKVVSEGATMVVCIGASIGKVGYAESKGSCNQQINVIPVSEQFIPRFVFIYCCSFWFKNQIEAKANYSSMPILSLRQFGKLVIPMPPLSVQQQVVDILDRFNALTTSLIDGLPAEIEARRQQYEYYRDKLLDFPRKGAAA